MNYTDADVSLQGRNHESRKVGNNTYLQRLDANRIALLLHRTDILIFTREHVTLNTGGWQTVTTKARMNDYLPAGVRIFQEAHVWYLQTGGYENGTRHDYHDHMRLDYDGRVINGVRNED